MSKTIPGVFRCIVLALNHIGSAVTVVALILEHYFTRTLRLDGFATEVVLDPWNGWVVAGIIMMMAGAVGLMFIAPKPADGKHWLRIVAGVLVLGIAFMCLSLRKTGFFWNNPNPALQSPWFAPHVTIYMVAYSLMAISTVLAVCMLIKAGLAEKLLGLTDSLVHIGTGFLTIGMLLGALWAKEAWGSYWNWDPKETWALITWGCYLVFLHLRKAAPHRWRAACIVLLAGFLCLQMCWWGVNLLTTASVHAYN